MPTLMEQASINVLKRLAGQLNFTGGDFAGFARDVTAAVNSDAQIRAFVSRSIENEMINLQYENPAYAGGNPKNKVFDGLFDHLRANKPNASGIEIMRSADAPAPKKFDNLGDLLSFLK